MNLMKPFTLYFTGGGRYLFKDLGCLMCFFCCLKETDLLAETKSIIYK